MLLTASLWLITQCWLTDTGLGLAQKGSGAHPDRSMKSAGEAVTGKPLAATRETWPQAVREQQTQNGVPGWGLQPPPQKKIVYDFTTGIFYLFKAAQNHRMPQRGSSCTWIF